MITEFIVHVIIDSDGIEIDRFFHEDDAEDALSHYQFFNQRKKYSIIRRLVTYSE